MHRFPALLLVLAATVVSAAVDERAFSACIADLQRQARVQGLPAELADRVLGELRLQPRVLELDRAQPEFTQSFAAYLDARVTPWKIMQGRMLYVRHRPLLDRLTKRHGVPGRYLVAFWGMETNYGSYLGSMPTLDSLATLACDERRSEFFAGELFHALRLIERDALDPASMKGSWAGAMGHMQFMPSSYAAHAVDGDGDGRIDLWASEVDAFASAANYLESLGWRRGERWGREVRLPEGFDYGRTGLDHAEPLSAWRRSGVTTAQGAPLPPADLSGSILVPMGHRGPAFLVYPNFEVILAWNRSRAYALAVGHLADRIAGGGALVAELPEVETALPRTQIENLQRRLAALGYDPGAVDGLMGPATRSALQEFEADRDRIADGYPDESTLEALGVEMESNEKDRDE